MSFVGARWWKFDFHTHTPASFDYGKGDSSLDGLSPRDWLMEYIEHGIECVAITDHNTGDWIDGAKEAAENLRAEGYSIYVFPGVEITANSNVHILGIFDPTCTSADIAAVVGASKFRGNKGDSNAVAEESAENVVKEILGAGGVAIPAHLDMKAGLCQQHSVLTIKQVCTHVNAVEIIFPDEEREDAPLSRYKNLNLDLPSVIGSDSHHPSKVGRAYTWVKMSSPSIEGLKLALVDGSSSLIRSEQEDSNPNLASNTLLHSVTIENAKYAGRQEKLKIEFNPWLNSIIGGRGSGKSSVLEFIRIGMDRSRDLLGLAEDNEIRRAFESFLKVSKSRDSDGVMLDSTKINCVYTRDGVHYLLTWTKENNSVSILRDDGGNWIEETGDTYSRFPVKIFSQKQIFDLAKKPNTLLRLIDESAMVGFQQWKMEWEEKCSHFQTLCSQQRELRSKLSNKDILLGQLSDIEQKIKALENSGHKEILTAFQSSRIKMLAVSQFENDIESLSNKVKSAIDSIPLPEIELSGFDVSVSGESEAVNKLNSLSGSVRLFMQSMSNAFSLIENDLTDFRTWYAQSEFSRSHNLAEESYNQLIDDLARQGIENPSDYSRLIGDRETIGRSLQGLSLVESQLNKLNSQIGAAYQAIIECRKRLTQSRLDFLSQYLSENSSIQVEISPFSDTDELESSFRSVIGRSDRAFLAELFDADRDSGILLKLNEKLSNVQGSGSVGKLEQCLPIIHNFKEQFLDFNSNEVFNTKFGKRFVDFRQQLQPQNFDSINTWFPGDKLTIKFNDGHRFKDVAQGSAGQKASAILSFLLSYGTEPLILDQPEDDLDNGLITNLIVSKLHENKSSRQIIVVTHNPNIVVNGDSEYVVALEDRGQIKTVASGALQEVSVRKNVCNIMEGGETALQQRYKRMFNI